MPGSLTEQAPLRGPEKKKRKKNRKLLMQLTRMTDNTLETNKKKMEMQKQNWGGHL